MKKLLIVIFFLQAPALADTDTLESNTPTFENTTTLKKMLKSVEYETKTALDHYNKLEPDRVVRLSYEFINRQQGGSLERTSEGCFFIFSNLFTSDPEVYSNCSRIHLSDHSDATVIVEGWTLKVYNDGLSGFIVDIFKQAFLKTTRMTIPVLPN